MARRTSLRVATAAALALAVCGALPSVARAQAFSYLPGTAHYRMIVSSAGVSDSPMGRHELAFDADERLTLTLARRTRDTLALTVVLDTITGRLQTGDPIDGRAASGLRVNARLSPLGRVYSRELPDFTGREAFRPAVEELSQLLPVLPPVLRPGVSWTDSTTEPVDQMGIEVRRTRVVTYTVEGDTTYAGERAWRVGRTARVVMAGSGTAMGTPLSYEGLSTGTGTLYVGRAGRYLGADLADEVNLKSTFTTLGQSISGTQKQTTRISLMR